MSEPQQTPRSSADEPNSKLRPLLVVVAFAAAAVGGFLGRGLAPVQTSAPTPATPRRPIVQIVRSPNFPSAAEVIDRSCPAIARITTAGASPSALPAFAVSADGWLVSAAPLPPGAQLQAIFGDGRKAAITETRTDPVSGVVIAHADVTGISALSFADQLFANVGDFGFLLQSPNGTGCTAQVSMIGSDFLVDAIKQGVYLRLQAQASPAPPGTPFVGADGSVIGVTSGGDNSVLPSPIAALIVNELIRNSVSPVASFGFRAIDFTPELAARIGDSGSRGAGVAIVQPKSSAAAAGLEAGDVVIAVDGSPVSSASELSRALDADNTAATLQVARGDQQLTMKVMRVTTGGGV